MNSGVGQRQEGAPRSLGGSWDAEKLVTRVDPKMRTHQAVHLRSVYFIVYISYLNFKKMNDSFTDFI